jgi:hypothetical protein
MLNPVFAVSAGVLVALGGILVFATRTGPQEASSNLSKWVAWLGFRPPKWLLDQGADRWGIRVAVVFFILAAGLFCAWVYAPQAQTTPGGVSGNCNNFGNNNFNCNTLNLGPKPRHLLPEQKEILSSTLHNKKVKFDLLYLTDPEVSSLTQDFIDAFTKAHVEFAVIPPFGQFMPPQYGIFLYDPKGEVQPLAAALLAADIPFNPAQHRAGTNPYPPETPALTITLKPPYTNY